MKFSGMKSFRSQTKLMVSGEYLVLKGVLSLALPLKFKQEISVSEQSGTPLVKWKSLVNNNLWFQTTMLLPDFQIIETNEASLSETLCKILRAAQMLNPQFMESSNEYLVTSMMDFDPAWGIGSSSSLISNIAYWANCDAFELNNLIFNGSGYDIACARSTSPIIYKLESNKPIYRKANFRPAFYNQLFFVYLNRKQNSRESVEKAGLSKVCSKDISEISAITMSLEKVDDLQKFQILIGKHEEIISKIIQIKPVKSLYFSDFNGAIKSLGAWGGDFILVASPASEEYVRNYFINKNLSTIFRYDEIAMVEKSQTEDENITLAIPSGF